MKRPGRPQDATAPWGILFHSTWLGKDAGWDSWSEQGGSRERMDEEVQAMALPRRSVSHCKTCLLTLGWAKRQSCPEGKEMPEGLWIWSFVPWWRPRTLSIIQLWWKVIEKQGWAAVRGWTWSLASHSMLLPWLQLSAPGWVFSSCFFCLQLFVAVPMYEDRGDGWWQEKTNILGFRGQCRNNLMAVYRESDQKKAFFPLHKPDWTEC